MSSRFRLILPLALAILLVDCTTKELAVETLSPEHVPHAVAGDVIRFTLSYNAGSAMSLIAGPEVRWPLVVLGFVVLGVLARLAWLTPAAATWRRVALGLLMGGALGNLLSRVSSPRGVVDFIDVGIGELRFYLFNVADVGVFLGACLLAVLLWREEQAAATNVPAA